ncbi:MAG TPA: GNAT family N-acetyltransferase [Opitutaceae bacterium]|nr:GNAT family N-acetyltransferase [Opitutaceae bacterium]
MTVSLEPATEKDAAAIAALRHAVARELTAQHGTGTWSFAGDSEGGVRADILSGGVYHARDEGAVVASLKLSPRSPWLMDLKFFTAGTRPLYLTSMAVSPRRQRQGVGRSCLAEARGIALESGHDAIRLDSYDAAAGAGEFYRKCGFREVRRDRYNGTPLLWFEWTA